MKNKTLFRYSGKNIFLLFLLLIMVFSLNTYATDEIKKLTHDDALTNDRMTAVAIDGDYAVAGVKNGDASGAIQDSGAVYVYYRHQGGTDNWGQQAKLLSNDIASGDQFGWSVAISGDYIVVGAYGDDHAAGDSTSGSAYIFQRSGTTWSQVAKLTSSDIGPDDHFGEDVAIDGAYVVVGAPRWDGVGDSGNGIGAAYIYERPGGGWTDMTETARITAATPADSLQFGEAVGVSGNYIVAGAYGYDDPSTATGSDGAGYVFYRNAGTWTQQAILTPPSYTQYDRVGHHAASISGDYVVLGGQGFDGPNESSGSAYVFYRNQGGTDNWGYQASLQSLVTLEERDNFGISAHIAGNYIIVGADSDDDDGSAAGCGYLFYRNGASWVYADKLLASDGESNDYKGKEHASCISTSGFAILGAEGEDGPTGDGKDDTGAAYLYTYGNPSITSPTHTSVTYTSATLGATVSGDGGNAITERGVVWATSANPTTTAYLGKQSSAGTTGVFTISASGLTPGATYHYRGYAINTNGTSYTSDTTFVTDSYSAPTVTTTIASLISYTTATSGGNVTSDGGQAITSRGVCWSTSADPTTAGAKTTDGTGTGSFSSSLTGLSNNQTYHYRAYAINSVGTSYGTDLTFKTDAFTAPTISSPTANAISSGSATIGGTVDDDGGSVITQRGVVWSSSANPTISVNEGANTSSGTTGIFSVSATGLSPSSVYHYRAYATNSVGTEYTTDQTFTTEALQNISGTVTFNSAPLSGVLLTFSNSGGSTTTAADGTYNHDVDYNWSGSVTPSLTSYYFTPTSRTFSNVQSAQINQNYAAAIQTYSITVSWSGSGTVTPNGGASGGFVSVNHGASQGFIFASNSGWFISDVKINSVSNPAAKASGIYNFVNVTDNQAIEIVFQEQTGQIQVNINPQSAVDAGAKWRIADGNWKSSGSVAENLAPGSYNVEFLAVDGYLTPTNLTASVSAGTTTTVSALYEKTGSAPGIRYFTASHELVGKGDEVDLSWDIDGADKVSIDNGVGAVLPSSGDKTVVVNKSTTFKIEASNDFGSSTALLMVNVGNKPEIIWFTSSNDLDNPITLGGSANLNWGVTGASEVTIGSVSSTSVAAVDDVEVEIGESIVTPSETTTYFISATNQLGTSTAEVVVGVTEAPEIIDFHAIPEKVIEGEETELFWEVINADSVDISPEVGQLNSETGSIAFVPSASGLYTLTATNKSGTDTSSIDIDVMLSAQASDVSVGILGADSAPALDKVVEGEVSRVTLEIENAGPAAAKNFFVRLVDGERIVGEILVKNLNSGSRKELVFNWIPLEEGKTILKVYLDPYAELLESSIENNSDSLKVRVKKVSQVDLLVSDIQLEKTPDKDYALLKFTVANVGNKNTGSFQFTAWSDKGKNKETVLLNDHFETFQKNGSVGIEKLISIKEFKNRIRITVKVDSNEVVSEENKANNLQTAVFKKKNLK